MPEADSTLNTHVVSASDGNSVPRVKTTQILSGGFLDGVRDAVSRQGEVAIAAWQGIDNPRSYPTDTGFGSLPGYLFLDGYGFDTTTAPGAVSLVPQASTPRDWYGTVDANRLVGYHGPRVKGTGPDQGAVRFDIDVSTETGVLNVPVADTSGATVYSLLLHFSTIPKTVEANPRTGAYEYTEEETVLGVVMEPDSVTDLGGGLIELVFPNTGDDTMYLCTDSMAGRTATVYLAGDPQDITANAIVDGTITFSTSRNRVQVSDLGQGTVSTTPSDYRVIIRGMTVTDYTAASLLTDMDSGVFLGTIHDGTPDSNAAGEWIAPTFAALLDDVLTYAAPIWAGGQGARRLAMKVQVKQADHETAESTDQISVIAGLANGDYSKGDRIWAVDGSGNQNRVIAEADFEYPANGNGAGKAERTFTTVATPLTNRAVEIPTLTSGSAALVTNVDRDLGGNTFCYWRNSEITGDTLVFYVPIPVAGVTVNEVILDGRLKNASATLEVEIGVFSTEYNVTSSGTQFTSKTGALTYSTLATGPNFLPTEETFSGGGVDFSDFQVSEGEILVAQVTLENVSADDAFLMEIKVSGTVQKNLPVPH